MNVDFGSFADTYRQHRRTSPVVLAELLRFGEVGPASRVLEIGCGTANYLTAIASETGAVGLGIDPSEQMIAQASPLEAGQVRRLQVGTAEALPVDDKSIDFAFMVDVVHVPSDLTTMASEAFRVLKPDGRFAIATDSEEDIRETAPLRTYFPETVEVELQRYPPVDRLTDLLSGAGFTGINLIPTRRDYEVTDISMYRERASSSLRLISDEAHAAGMVRLEAALAKGPISGVSRYALVEAIKPR